MPGASAVSRSWPIFMSFTTFQFEVKRRWKILKEGMPALINAHLLFAGQKELWPDQCQNFLTLLSRIENPVLELREILENTANFPASAIQLRHLLLMSIQHTDEQIRALKIDVAEIRTLCQIQSKRSVKLRQEIEYELSLLVRECDDAVINIATLLDQTRFQEGKHSELQRRELLQEAHFYEQSGYEYNNQGREEEALEFFEEALRLVHKLGDHRREGRILEAALALVNGMADQRSENRVQLFRIV